MSTKAFDFFIMDKEKLNSYLFYTKKVITLCLIARFNKHNELCRVFATKSPFDSWDAFKKLIPEVTRVMQSSTYTNNEELDLTAGVSIWLWKNMAVVKIYGFKGGLASLMKQPRYVKDFSYWNNTDKPDEIDNKEWQRRERFFEKTIDTLPLISYVPYDFMSNNAYHHVFELRREYDALKGKKKDANTE
jgi:hypothetical protein